MRIVDRSLPIEAVLGRSKGNGSKEEWVSPGLKVGGRFHHQVGSESRAQGIKGSNRLLANSTRPSRRPPCCHRRSACFRSIGSGPLELPAWRRWTARGIWSGPEQRIGRLAGQARSGRVAVAGWSESCGFVSFVTYPKRKKGDHQVALFVGPVARPVCW